MVSQIWNVGFGGLKLRLGAGVLVLVGGFRGSPAYYPSRG